MVKGRKEQRDVRIGESEVLALDIIAKHLYEKEINLSRWHIGQISRQGTEYFFHRFRLPDLANKNIRFLVKFESEINSEDFF